MAISDDQLVALKKLQDQQAMSHSTINVAERASLIERAGSLYDTLREVTIGFGAGIPGQVRDIAELVNPFNGDLALGTGLSPIDRLPEQRRMEDVTGTTDNIGRAMGGNPESLAFQAGAVFSPSPGTPLKIGMAGMAIGGKALAKLEEALRMRGAGLWDEVVEKATGWLRQPDGAMAFNISDVGVRVNWDTINSMPPGSSYNLGDILIYPNDELFLAYPQLRNVRVSPTIGDEYYSKVGASFSPGLGDLRPARITSRSAGEQYDEFLDLLLHEVQHAIQDIEGWSWGSSFSAYTKPVTDAVTGKTVQSRVIGSRVNLGDVASKHAKLRNDLAQEYLVDQAAMQLANAPASIRGFDSVKEYLMKEMDASDITEALVSGAIKRTLWSDNQQRLHKATIEMRKKRLEFYDLTSKSLAELATPAEKTAAIRAAFSRHYLGNAGEVQARMQPFLKWVQEGRSSTIKPEELRSLTTDEIMARMFKEEHMSSGSEFAMTPAKGTGQAYAITTKDVIPESPGLLGSGAD